MNAPAVHTTNWNTPTNRVRRTQANGKPTGLSRGAWVSDLVSLRKALTLCRFCQRKFNHQAHHYTPRVVCGRHEVTSDCDGCNARFTPCRLYRHEEIR